ncbi:MAG TPA: hypothetical protein VGR63_01590 [Casimicrobiaceae bacterium]|nr:hypothetical protein [Casimicrobiaceae bacterium]
MKIKLLMLGALLVSSLGGCVYVPYDDHYHGYHYGHHYYHDDGYYHDGYYRGYRGY